MLDGFCIFHFSGSLTGVSGGGFLIFPHPVSRFRVYMLLKGNVEQ